MSEASVPEAVVIGASAGALEALLLILPALPAGYGLPIFIVVHIPPDKDSVLADLIQSRCKIAVREAEDKEPIAAGTAYLAPPDYHLLIETDKSLSLSADEPVLFSRPSLDVLFESAADAYGPSLIAIVLTGGNEDGSRGLRAVADAGGKTIVQCPEGAYVATMPQAAIALCPEAEILPLEAIAAYLQSVGKVELPV